MVVSIDALKESVVILHIGIWGVFVEERSGEGWSGRTQAGRQRLGLIIAFKKLFYHALSAYAVPQ